MNMNLRLIALGLSVALVFGILAAGYVHYTGLVSDLAGLTANKTNLETELRAAYAEKAVLRGTIAAWQKSAEASAKRAEALQKLSVVAQAEYRSLSELFSRHNLEALAKAKPGLVQRRVDAATERARILLQCASDANCPAPRDPAAGPVPETR